MTALEELLYRYRHRHQGNRDIRNVIDQMLEETAALSTKQEREECLSGRGLSSDEHSTWRLIESAPKDGTKVCVWVEWRDTPSPHTGWCREDGHWIVDRGGQDVQPKVPITLWCAPPSKPEGLVAGAEPVRSAVIRASEPPSSPVSPTPEERDASGAGAPPFDQGQAAVVEEMAQQFEELIQTAEHDMKLNQDEENEGGGWWSLRTENCFAPARAAVAAYRALKHPADVAGEEPELRGLDLIEAIRRECPTSTDVED